MQGAENVPVMKGIHDPSSTEKKEVDVNAVIERAAIACSREWESQARLDLHLAPGLPKIPGIEADLFQVALNMIVHAAHAIAERGIGLGKITIRTARDDGGIAITIEDTGSGIPDAARTHIFHPITGAESVGNSIGQELAVCSDIIVNKHDGKIDIIRSDGNGTVFRIFLPGKGAEIFNFRPVKK